MDFSHSNSSPHLLSSSIFFLLHTSYSLSHPLPLSFSLFFTSPLLLIFSTLSLILTVYASSLFNFTLPHTLKTSSSFTLLHISSRFHSHQQLLIFWYSSSLNLPDFFRAFFCFILALFLFYICNDISIFFTTFDIVIYFSLCLKLFLNMSSFLSSYPPWRPVSLSSNLIW